LGINFRLFLSLGQTNNKTNKQTDIAHVKRIRNGEHQTLETLINEEALLFAKYIRGETKGWAPRIAS
jgi:hypothetical protein